MPDVQYLRTKGFSTPHLHFHYLFGCVKNDIYIYIYIFLCLLMQLQDILIF